MAEYTQSQMTLPSGDVVKFKDSVSGYTTTKVKGNSESSYRTGEVNLTAANIGAAASSHTHGNIQNGGTLQTNDVAIANGDKLVVTDSSDSAKVARTSLSFDGSTTTQFLSKKGTWETPSAGDNVIYYGDVATSSETLPLNADQLQGHAASYFQRVVLSGTTEPSSSLGSNGDIYIMYEE